MAKNKSNPVAGNQPVNRPPVAQKAQPVQPPKSGKPSALKLADGQFTPMMQLLIAASIAIITFFFLKVCLDNQFTNWDDPGYIKDNATIKDISSAGLARIFSLDNPIMGNYHPLTILTYGIEYSFVRLEPWLYHLDSLLFHILVTLLVFVFVNKLTGRPIAAAVASLLFGLHPMHVESVAWVAGRKDVVYGAFYMAACLTWLYYIRVGKEKKGLFYVLTALLFILSLLAKPVAVVLPITLLLIDYFEKRELKLSLLIEKAPLLAISVAFGIKSMLDQKKFGSLNTLNVDYNPLERICLGAYALVTYLWKAIVPIGLANYYPYPDKVGKSLPALFFIYPVIVIAALGLFTKFVLWPVIASFRADKTTETDTKTKNNDVLIFGVFFFFINIILLLQFIPVGGAIVAERYSYIAYLGLFIMAGWYVSAYFETGGNRSLGNVVLGAVLVYSLVLGYLSNERCKVWYDTTTLWTDEIRKEPDHAPNAYNNLGFNYFNKYNESVNPADRKRYYDSSYMLLSKAIQLQPTFVNPYISIGELLRTAGNFPDAKWHYYKALSLKSFDEDANAYLGLAIIYAISHNFDSSKFCFKECLRLKPYFPEAVSNYGNLLDMTGQHDSALVWYGIAVNQNPDMYAPYLNRGRSLQRMHRCEEAMKDFDKSLSLSPDNGEVHYAMSFCYAQKDNKAMALKEIQKAVSLGFTQIDKNYYAAMGGR